MISTATTATSISTIACLTCKSKIERGAKFCGQCGALTAVYGQNPAQSESPTVPSFAPISARHQGRISPQMREELGQLMVLLARERLFLYLHWLIFLASNLFGFWLAVKCYQEYIGDEMTKIMMSSTPLLYINTVALMCIVPIRGTRREIARLKERINHMRFQIEFNHLV